MSENVQQDRKAARSAALAADEERWERPLPAWQQWLNTFCENWIFAFIVAMVIRSFFIEAYRIPSASMEPVLYGDPALFKGDFVVVDRISHYFVKPHRWEVTVFQYPEPEIFNDYGAAVSAVGSTGERMDHLISRPLIHRNFVKRCVVLPGDTFYIAGGDLRLQQDDGSWITASKPDDVQEALWLPIYRHGDEPGYVPWAGGTVEETGPDSLVFAPGGGSIRFQQPLLNLYMKPGQYRVAPLEDALDARGNGRDVDGIVVEASLTEPIFTYADGISERQGNVWHLQDRWEVARLTSADLDSPSHGKVLNPIMDEQVGDLRISFRVADLDEAVALEIAEGDAQRFLLHLHPAGWQLLNGAGTVLAKGSEPVVGAQWALVHLDDRIWVERDGEALMDVIATEAVIPDEDPTSLRWRGSGRITVQELLIERDVHYSRSGFLADYSQPDRQTSHEGGGLTYKQIAGAARSGAKWADRLLRMRAGDLAMQEAIRSEIGPASAGWQEGSPLGAIGVSPETAITAPPGAYLLLGDNSPFSLDSRSWCWVPEANLRGEVLAVAFPPWRWKVVR